MPPKGVKRGAAQDGWQDVRLGMQLTVTGGAWKKPVLLPTTASSSGQVFVKFGLQEDWLNAIVAGACRGTLSCNGSVAKLMSEIQDAKGGSLKQLSSAAAEVARASAEEATAGRKALALSDSDSDHGKVLMKLKLQRNLRKVFVVLVGQSPRQQFWRSQCVTRLSIS